jgi:hypothetical protein
LERKEYTGPQPIADAIRTFLRSSALQRSKGDDKVFSAWADAAGETWSRHAVPTSFRGGQLFVEVSSSVRMSELRGFHLAGIQARANQALGEKRIKKVVLKLKS